MPGVPDTPGYIRPDPAPAPSLPTIKKSAVGKHHDGSDYSFSTLADYVEHYVAQGLVKNQADLIQNYGHLIAEIFINWVSAGRLGCLFASVLAGKPRENRWLPIVQLGALSQGPELSKSLNTTLDGAGESYEAAVIIFPDIVTEDEIVALVNLLCSDPSGRWYRTNDGIDPDADGKLSLIGLRWILESSHSVNWVLGFSSLHTMPFTRQSPFTALFLRIKEEKRSSASKEDGRVQVHLADLDSLFHPQDKHNRVWDLTKLKRAKHVEPHMTAAARARVAFSVSQQAASKLCAPRVVKIEKE